MYPWLLPDVFEYTFPMYDIMIMIGIFVMLAYVAKRLETKDGYTRKQTNKLLLLLIISLGVALFSSWLVDGIFHTIKEGELTFGTITFIGGLAGGVLAYLIFLKYFYTEENKDVKKIMNTIITGVVIAHAFGRIGCLMAGCCYGIPTDSFLGVVFPHGDAAEAFPGIAIFPTQLFESLFLFLLFALLNFVKKFKNIEVEIYLIGYGVWRFLIEFIRGDDRGELFGFFSTQYNTFPTPSQYLSLLMIIAGVVMLIRRKKRLNETVMEQVN
ncbi:MAG: prolipoprotein diacylglyceryl transferase [Bacilli bacterium]|nr:prolipoprotein diacylglyceryl transferase [Bacilli bacterium]